MMNSRRFGIAGCLLLCFSLVACSDEVAPRTIRVAVQASPLSTSVELLESGPLVLCNLLLSANAVGSDRMMAAWQEGRIEVLAGNLGNVSAGYITLNEAELREIWSKPGIGAGEEMQAELLLGYTEPFNGRGVFRYLPEGAATADTARFNFRCAVDGFEPVGPVKVNLLELVDPPVTINPGESLTVRYHASGDMGIISTEIQVASEHLTVRNRYDERGWAPYVSRTVQVPVTNDHPLGSELRIRVVATSAPGVQATSDWLAGPTVVDMAHPQIHSYCLTAAFGDMCNIYPAELPFDLADTIRIKVNARDNYGLRHFVWWVDDLAADSLEIEAWTDTEFEIPVQSSWADAKSITFYVEDEAGLHSPMVSHAIRMIPRLDRPTRTRLLSGSFDRAVADEDGQTLYLTSQDNLVAAISLETMEELWRREVPGSPRGIDISPDQSTLAVALSEADAVVLLDAAGGGSARRSIALGNGFSAQAVSYVADGSILIAGDTVLPIVRVSSEGAILDRSYGLHRYSPPWDSFRSHDYSRVFFRGGGFCGFVYDAASDSMAQCTGDSLYGARPSVSLDGERVLGGPYLYDRDLRPSGLVEIPGLSYDEARLTALSGDGRYGFTAHPKGLLGTNIGTGRFEFLISQPTIQSGSIIHAGSGRLLVSIGPELGGDGTRTRVTVVEYEQ